MRKQSCNRPIATASCLAKMTGKAVAEVWYSIEPCADNILRFRESHIDTFAVGDIWLVRGSERDLAIDTGCGMVPSAPLIEAVAAKPVTAVALNCYYDHSGGWHGFSDRACHRLDAPELLSPDAEQAEVHRYLNDQTLWALPYQGYLLENYALTGAQPSRLVEDGDRFELGNRSLEVMHTAGRTPGGLVIWEAATGSLFTSDMLYDGRHGDAWPPPDPDAYCTSLRRMRALPVQCVYPGHYDKMDYSQMLEVIDRQLADLEGPDSKRP